MKYRVGYTAIGVKTGNRRKDFKGVLDVEARTGAEAAKVASGEVNKLHKAMRVMVWVDGVTPQAAQVQEPGEVRPQRQVLGVKRAG